MFDHLLESSRRDDSNKWSNIGFDEKITKGEAIEVYFTHLIWSSGEGYLAFAEFRAPDKVHIFISTMPIYFLHRILCLTP